MPITTGNIGSLMKPGLDQVGPRPAKKIVKNLGKSKPTKKK